MANLCGDETGPLVLDMGSRTFKFGFGGEDSPKGWIPSAVGQDSKGSRRQSLIHQPLGTEIIWAKKAGKIENWDAAEELWTHAISHDLSSPNQTNPILMASGTNESHADRTKTAEIMFESLQVPALFLARNAQLSAFSMGRASALVVDIGASGTIAVTVNDGFVLQDTCTYSRIGGDVVDEHLLRILESGTLSESKDRTPIKVSCMLRRGVDDLKKMIDRPKNELDQMTNSYLAFKKFELLDDLKSSVCRVWTELNYDENVAAQYIKEVYELPDGTIVSIGADRFKSPELLVTPTYDTPFVKEFVDDMEQAKSVQKVIVETLMKTHPDLRREVVQQIMLVGGAGLLPGTVERLTKELTTVLPGALKPKFLLPAKTERIFSCFIGGSVLGSLGSFQQLWISKQEFEEYGEKILMSRCCH